MSKPHISISLRLTMWFGGIFLFGWLLFGTSMWLTLKSTLKGERYQTLDRRVDRLAELLRKNKAETEADRIQDFSDFAHATGNGLAEVFRADGTRAYPSPSSAAQSFPWPVVHIGDTERFVHVDSAGQPYWVLVRPYSLEDQTLFLVVAAPEAGNLLVLQNFWRGLLWWAPLLLLIASASGYWVSRRALQPVDRITAAARSISIRNLSGRLPIPETGDELQRLTETCNAMLARLDSAVKQIKQFTADASHELRGPLSFTRTVTEVALRNPRIDPDSRRAFIDILDETVQASALLEEMLTLARADSEPFDRPLEPLDLVALVEDACGPARPLAAERNLTLAIACGSEDCINVLGDVSSLRRLVWILLDNALKYTEADGRIDVTLQTGFGQATLLVSDTGIGIAPADLPRVFDRFYRADPSRSQVEGSGLGLAIAKWIAEVHHADLSVTSEPDKGTAFRLTLPLCES